MNESVKMACDYFAFLLRIWSNSDIGNSQWLISLEDPKSHKLTYFKTMEELFDFFMSITHTNDQLFQQQGITETQPK